MLNKEPESEIDQVNKDNNDYLLAGSNRVGT